MVPPANWRPEGVAQCQEQTDWIRAEKEWSEKCQNIVPLHPESVYFLRVESAGSGIPFLAILNSGLSLRSFCSHCSSIKSPRTHRHIQPSHIAFSCSGHLQVAPSSPSLFLLSPSLPRAC